MLESWVNAYEVCTLKFQSDGGAENQVPDFGNFNTVRENFFVLLYYVSLGEARDSDFALA